MTEPRLVLGTWGLAGAHGAPARPMGYGALDASSARRLLSAAWDAGIRWVDTAPSYGAGEGLRRVAAWQASTGRRLAIVMKPGRPLVAGEPVSRLAMADLERELRACEASVGPPSSILLKDPPRDALESGAAFEVIEELERRYPGVRCGFASHELAAAARAPRTTRERIAQLEVNGLSWRTSRAVAMRLRDAGWTVWAMQPLGYGFLAGRRACTFPTDDFRSRIPEPTQRALEAAAGSFLTAFRRALGAHPSAALDAARLSLAFCLALPEVARVVVGPRSLAQLDGALEAERLARDPVVRAAAASFAPVTPG